jgi:methionyl-tRNA formyltransferase
MTHRLRIAYAGTPAFAVPALDALHARGYEIVAVYTQPDRPAGRGQSVTASPVKVRALELRLPVEQPVTLRSPEVIERLRGLDADLMVVAAYGLILPREALDAPHMGCWNIHASLLPRWRGAAPIQRAILAGDSETGVTIMQMDAGLDTGSMLLGKRVLIGVRETAGELHDRLATLGAQALIEALEERQARRLLPQPQPSEGVTYAPKIRKEESLIDWTSPAPAIDRQVRAFNPWPVAETRWEGRQLRVWSAEPVAKAASAAPGQVIEASDGRLVVATGDGALGLTRVQLAGRRAVTAAEFLNAHALAGARLG